MSPSSTPKFGKYDFRQNQRDFIPRDENSIPEGAALDLLILGNGYFVVRNTENNDLGATQSGHFSVDENGYLVNAAGARLQGRTGGDLSPLGDLQINAAGLRPGSVPRSAMLCYTIDDWGKISAQLSDGSYYLCGQILLQNFQDPQALVCEGNELYSNMDAAGPLPAMAAPGTHGLGTIQSSVLELAIVEQTCGRD
jgi:flagellar hook protein FlgE